ncbi:MAG TPA: glycosyltransferase family A protein [Rhizomicrobium sp.]|jgi:glycosyltransferase involved in cell wall biosynthesis
MSRPQGQRISAIIPAYNRAGFLAETLNAIASQTEPPDEIIVVDDGSTDDTAVVVEAFSENVRYLRISNSGAPVARNIGAAQASGDWLWFCDSDDLWRPEYLARVRNLLDTQPHPKFVFGNFRLVKDGIWADRAKFDDAPPGFWDNAPSARSDSWIIPGALYAKLLAYQPVFHSTLVVSRALFGAIGGYDPHFARTGSEDFEFVLRCAAHGPAAVVGEPLVGIRRHGDNFSTNQLRNLLGEIEILRHAKLHHEAANGLSSVIERQISLRSLQALGFAFSEGNYPLVQSLAVAARGEAMGIKDHTKALLAALPNGIRAPAVALMARRPQ